jgi:uncharacterized protein (TIGR02611 family)
MEKLRSFLSKLPHPLRWILSVTIGSILLIMGLIMLVTPGPGLLFIFLGLTILALEIEWARQLHKEGMQGLEKLVARAKSFLKIN